MTWILRGLNYKFWSHLGCSETKATVFPHNIIALGFHVEKFLFKKYIHTCVEDSIFLFQHLSTILLQSLNALIRGLFYLFRGQIVPSYARGLLWQASWGLFDLFTRESPLVLYKMLTCAILSQFTGPVHLLSLHKTKKLLYINDHNCNLCTLFFAELSLKFCS